MTPSASLSFPSEADIESMIIALIVIVWCYCYSRTRDFDKFQPLRVTGSCVLVISEAVVSVAVWP